MRTQIRTDLAALVAAILASKGVEVQEVWVDALADVRLDARGWATLDRLGREHKQLKYFNGTASLGAMGRFALGYHSFSDFTAFMSDDFALEPAMREIPLRIGLLISDLFGLCTLLCATEFVEFLPDFWCTTFQSVQNKSVPGNSCHPPPEKKRRVWEVLRISDIKDIKYIKISKSDIKDI